MKETGRWHLVFFKKRRTHVGEKEEGLGRVTGRWAEMDQPQDSRGFLSTGNPWAQGP